MTKLTITNLRTLVVRGNFDWVLARVDTDAGISGYGESMVYPEVRRLELSMLTQKPRLIGEDAFNVAALVRKMGLNARMSLNSKGISGIEMALWDAAGKALGVPVYRLLGGKVRDRVRIYADCHAGQTITRREDYDRGHREQYTAEAYANTATWAVSQGFTFVKFDLGPSVWTPFARNEGSVRQDELGYYAGIVAAIRQAIGADIDLALDSGGWPSPKDVIRFANMIEEYGIRWLEDVVHTVEGFQAVRAATRIPILTGEMTPAAIGFKELVQSNAVDIIHPDAGNIGGLWEWKRAAALAECFDIQAAGHNCLGPVGTMANAHVCCTVPNFLALEFHCIGLPWWQNLVKNPEPIISEGYVEPKDSPGLGVELNPEEVLQHVDSLEEGERFFA